MDYSDLKYENVDFESDQDKKLPQPPLVKERMREESIDLPRNFKDLSIQTDFLNIINTRHSSRVYTNEAVSLLELSYMLWTCQSVKELRGKKYATLRTVPSGGARHGFELYFVCQNVEGLEPGTYHYLPMEHKIEFLNPLDQVKDVLSASLCDQTWALKANVIFYFSYIPYRTEWRYGDFAHRIALVDLGHIGENIYLASTSVGLGTCGIGACVTSICDKMFELNGQDEFILYAQPIGKVKKEDFVKEKSFYEFVEKEGL